VTIASDPHLPAEDIALGYKQLLEIERGWRDRKQVIALRRSTTGTFRQRTDAYQTTTSTAERRSQPSCQPALRPAFQPASHAAWNARAWSAS
jgi:hypothetical protein